MPLGGERSAFVFLSAMGCDQREQHEVVCDQVELADLACEPEALARARGGRRPAACPHLGVHQAREYRRQEPERALGAHLRGRQLRAPECGLVVAEIRRGPTVEEERNPPRVDSIALQLGLERQR
jgi:hypothetical protein